MSGSNEATTIHVSGKCSTCGLTFQAIIPKPDLPGWETQLSTDLIRATFCARTQGGMNPCSLTFLTTSLTSGQ